jgi:protein arginine N-methyltransferase 1
MLIDYHRRMLADAPRLAAFEAALGRLIVPGETVVADIGAGTGVLALLACRLGAREVHLYEQGDVLELAVELAEANGCREQMVFHQGYSTEVMDPERVDLVVSETLGNLALEEHILHTLTDARARYLKPGGVLIPQALRQFVAPVTGPRLLDDLCSWDRVGHGLDFAAAKRVALDNLYVEHLTPAELGDVADARCWDQVDFLTDAPGPRSGRGAWRAAVPWICHGFVVWWECDLLPDITLSTSPWAPRSHWDQLYLPVRAPLALQAGDELVIDLDCDGAPGMGMDFRWGVEQRRGEATVAESRHDIAAGFLG